MKQDDWMSRNTVDDVSQAINTQVIQTTLEKSNTDLSPQALQSFMTNAPIPRLYYSGDTATHGSGTNVTCTWSSAGSVDPYNIMNPSTGIMTLPIDGFYSGVYFVHCTGSAGSAIDVSFLDGTKSNTYAHQVIDFYTPSSTLYVGMMPMLIPFKAGSTLLVNVGNSTAITLVPTLSFVSLVWTAPFTNYQSGGQ